MNTEVLLEAKPKFVGILSFLGSLIWVWLVPYIGSFLFYLLLSEVFKLPEALVWHYTILLSVLTAVVYIKIYMYANRKNYEVSNYKVYSDRIEFEEGFFNHKYTIIKIEDIKEIHLSQNFVQRQFQVGSIRFVTAANAQTANGFIQSGVCFKDIENSMAIYAKIKQIHSEG